MKQVPDSSQSRTVRTVQASAGPKESQKERNLGFCAGSRVRRVFLKGSFRAPNPPNSQWVLKGGANSGWIWVNVFLNIGGGFSKRAALRCANWSLTSRQCASGHREVLSGPVGLYSLKLSKLSRALVLSFQVGRAIVNSQIAHVRVRPGIGRTRSRASSCA